MDPAFVLFERSGVGENRRHLEHRAEMPTTMRLAPVGWEHLQKGKPLWKQERFRATNGRPFSTFSINSTRASWQRLKSLVRKWAHKKKRVTYRLKASRWHRAVASRKQSLSV